MTSPSTRFRGRGLKIAFGAFRIVVSIGIMAYLVLAFDWDRLQDIAGRLRLGLASIGPLLILISFGWGALRWSVLLGHFGVKQRWSESFSLYLIGSFYNVVLPGMLGGDVVRVGFCAARTGKPLPEIATTTLIERSLGLVAILMIGSTASLMIGAPWKGQLDPMVGLSLPVLTCSVLVASAIGWAALRFPSAAWFLREYRWRPLRALARLLASLRELTAGMILQLLLLSVLCQFPAFVSAYMLGKALGIDLPLVVFCVVMPIVTISTMLPISLGGLGVREGLLTFLLTRLDVAGSEAIALAFLIYLVYVIIALGGGLTQLLWHPAARRDGTEEGSRPDLGEAPPHLGGTVEAPARGS
jgi:uncharacterized membrane protein YbhN (UPF0104 family)